MVRTPHQTGTVVRGLIGGYALLAAFAAVVALLPRLPAWLFALAVLLLALPMALALWQRGAVRSLVRVHRFTVGRWPYRWAVRRVLRQLGAAVLAIAVTAGALVQGPFFGALEWGLLAAVPPLYLAVRHVFTARAAPLFSRRVYAADAATAAARLVTFGLACGAWLAGRYLQAGEPAPPLAELAYELQSRWPEVASAAVRWALDAAAWGQAALVALGHVSDSPWWRSLLALIVLPASLFGYATWSVSGVAADAADVRRTFGDTLTDVHDPPAVPSRRFGAYATAGALFAAVLLAFAVYGDALLAREERALALRPIPACERIGGVAYAVGTLAAANAYASALEAQVAGRRASACARLDEVARVAARNVDAYLDWYWSLGAEWLRLALMLTGDVDTLLEVKFYRMVAADARMSQALGDVQEDQRYLMDVSARGGAGLASLLERERLVESESRCRVVSEASAAATQLPQLDGVRTRLLASTASGVAAGAFAGAVTARAMSRATMQAAGRVLGKAAACRGASRVGSAAAGAAAGSVVAPGIGTIAGLAVGAGVDIALLSLEEKLTRESMRRDLIAAVEEALAPWRAAFDCPGR